MANVSYVRTCYMGNQGQTLIWRNLRTFSNIFKSILQLENPVPLKIEQLTENANFEHHGGPFDQ